MKKILGCFSSLILMSFAQAKTVYIAPNGDDANDGLSDTAPVKTLADAYAKANEAGDTIQFLDGTYTFANFPETTVVKRGITFAGNPSDRTAVTWDMAGSGIAYVIEQQSGAKDIKFKDLTYCNSAAPAIVRLINIPTQFEMSNCVVRDCSAYLIYMTNPGNDNGCTYAFNNVRMERMVSTGGAGFMTASGNAAKGARFEFTDCQFVDNGQGSQQNGGVIYSRFADAVWKFSHCEASGNYASASNGRGGFFTASGNISLFVENSTFSNNWASAGGGAFFIGGAGAKSEFRDCEFYGNTTTTPNTSAGGAVKIEASNATTNQFFNCSFDSCSAPSGGALSGTTVPNRLDVSNCTFKACSATSNGGALYCKGDVSVWDSRFTGNTSARGGAVSFPTQNTAADCQMAFSGCAFTNNVAQTYGGAIDANGLDLTLGNCTFFGNTGNNGAAMFLGGWGSRQITDCVFDSSTGSSAVYLQPLGGDFCRFVRCDFLRCNAKNGAAFRSHNSLIPEVLFDGCRMVGNTCEKGILFKNSCKGAHRYVLRNSVIAGNHVTDRGSSDSGMIITVTCDSIETDHSACTNVIENCTFADNHTGKWAVLGTNVNTDDRATFIVRNSIFWNNVATVSGGNGRTNFARDLEKQYVFENNISDQDITAYGTGNTMADPRFTHEGTWSADVEGNPVYNFDGDYTFAKRSPARDAGARLSWMTADAKDFAGNPRVFGSAPDLGAYEYKSISGLILIFK